MIVSFILKVFLLYFLFLAVRGLWRGYKIYGAMQEALKGGAGHQGHTQNAYRKPQSSSSSASGDIIEAEYRVVDSNKKS